MTNGTPGPPVDATGRAVLDPSENVKALNEAAVARLDDLRLLTLELINARLAHIKEVGDLRAQHAAQMGRAEGERVNAIRSVDVAAADQLRRDTAQQASQLAQLVTTTAETLRSQVAATALAAKSELTTSLAPMQNDIAVLRQAMFEAAGSKAQVVETRAVSGEVRAAIGLGITILLALLGLVGYSATRDPAPIVVEVPAVVEGSG